MQPSVSLAGSNVQQGEESGGTSDLNAPGKVDDSENGFDSETSGIEPRPIQALYITNYSNRWHDYIAQKDALMNGIVRYINIEFDLVGKDPDDSLSLMDIPDFGVGYDVIIYNMCFADDFDTARINNIISQTRDLGIPSVLLHCTMHSFQQSSPSYPEHQLELLAAEWDWRDMNPKTEFPYWWRFTGVDTLKHDWPRSVTAIRTERDHPVTTSLPEQITFRKDELYQNIQVMEGVTPLYTAYSRQSNRDHLVAWTHTVGAGQVFATTLGHDLNTMENPAYHELIANGIAHVTGKLKSDGQLDAMDRGTQPAENYQATVVCQPSDIVNAYNVEEVQDIVRRAFNESRSLKVISVPHSNSNSEFICPEHGGLLLNVGQMSGIINLDQENMIVTVQPGIRAVELSQYLHEQGLAIRAMPDYTGVSIAGGIATAAHHSSLQIPSSMADMVESISIVDGRGELRQFEGSEAASAAAHLGMLGVVVEIGLRVEPQFKLQYGSNKGRDEGLEDVIEDMVSAHDYARVMWFAGVGRYVLDYYDRVDIEEAGTSKHNTWTSSGSVFRFIGDLPYRILNRAPLRAQCDSALLRANLWLAPIKTESSSRSNPVGWSHEMLGSSCQPGTCPWSNDAVRSRTMEASFPLSQLPAWMADVRSILGQTRACFPILGIYLRFSKASDRWLGFNYGEDVVSFEIHIPKVATETYQERSADVYDEIMQMTLGKYNGRPHWGKNSTPMFVGVGEAQYPRWSDFLELKQSMDPAGLFDNRIWRQMDRSTPIRSYPGCVLARECICAKDSDCGEGYACESGVVYTPARVCRER
jgi:FAD/FMN-containing dehydrogenase